MPPRKRAKFSAASTPLAESQPKTPVESGPPTTSQDPSPSNEYVHIDPWTDGQETQLFKSMIKLKPTGMHKHFRMLSIHNSLLTHGFASPNAPHTRISGIWSKLGTLYDLNALDARENAYMFDASPDPELADEDSKPEFQLPEDEFGEDMWGRRFADADEEDPDSPPEFLPTEEDKKLYRPGIGLLSGVYESVEKEKEESHTSPATRPRAGTRTGRGAAATAKARAAKAAQGTKAAKAQSVVSESVEDEEESESSEEESENSSSEEAPPTKSAKGGRRGKPARRGRKR